MNMCLFAVNNLELELITRITRSAGTPSLCNYRDTRRFLYISPKHLSDSVTFTFWIGSHNH